ncbi:MAG: ParB/RepB/Spo0J family partition protein [Candidatus Ancillula sp.]|jgi:ParB family chromosome partitioning protein|nr:ParB/RepB/Spo0J family partition protein [Candidatus Ancillula sp.]
MASGKKHHGLGMGLASLIPQSDLPANKNSDKQNIDLKDNDLTSGDTFGANKPEKLNKDVHKPKKIPANARRATGRESGGSSRYTVGKNTAGKNKRAMGVDALIPQSSANQSSANQSLGGSLTQVKLKDSSKPVLAVPGLELTEIEVDKIVPNRSQPRLSFDEGELQSLANNISENGLIQPPTVRKIEQGQYELISGERRLRAVKILKWDTVPVLIRTADDLSSALAAIAENLQRVDLNPLDTAKAYDQLVNDFGLKTEDIAKKMGISGADVRNTLRLLNAPESVQNKIASGVIGKSQAKVLLGLKDSKLIENMANRVIQEGLSVRSLEEEVNLLLADSDSKFAKSIIGSTDQNKSQISSDKIKDPRIKDYEDSLADTFDTVVEISSNRKGKGNIKIKFADEKDLQRIVDYIER